MDLNLVLLIVLIALAILCVGLLVLQYFVKPKKNLDITDVMKTIEWQYESTLKEVMRENESMIRIYREANANLSERIAQYNAEVSKNIEGTSKIQREVFAGMEARLNEIFTNNEARLERINQNVSASLNKMQEGNEKKLNEMRTVVEEKLSESLEKRLNSSLLGINERLESVYKGLGEMQKLASDVGDISKVLANVKTRGIWGEVQLGNLLEQMLSAHQFTSQMQIGKDENTRVDFAVVMPGRGEGIVYLPIDSKCPMDYYERLIEASETGDAVAVEKAGKELEVRIKSEAKKISSLYIKVPLTTDFAIMYLPIEGLFAEVVKKSGLVEVLQREYRVMVCGPTTLSALLSSLQMGFRTMAIEQRSSEIWALLNMFRSEFGKFTELLYKTQKKLSEASSSIESATKKTAKISKGLNAVQAYEPKGGVAFDMSELGLDDDEQEDETSGD